MDHHDDNTPVIELAAELRRGVSGRDRSLEGQGMKFYLRYVNPVLAVAVLVIGLMSVFLEWDLIIDKRVGGENVKSIRWGGFLQNAWQTYFLAKTIFCSATLFLLGKLTEYVMVLISRPVPGEVGVAAEKQSQEKTLMANSVHRAVPLLLLVLMSQSFIAVGADKLEFAPVEIQFVEKLEQVQGIWDQSAGRAAFANRVMVIEDSTVRLSYSSDVEAPRTIEGQIEISEGAILVKEKGRKKPQSRWQLVEVDDHRYLMSLRATRTKGGEWVWGAPVMLHKMVNLNGTLIKSP